MENLNTESALSSLQKFLTEEMAANELYEALDAIMFEYACFSLGEQKFRQAELHLTLIKQLLDVIGGIRIKERA